jgi:hypothetical protein
MRYKNHALVMGLALALLGLAGCGEDHSGTVRSDKTPPGAASMKPQAMAPTAGGPSPGKSVQTTTHAE